MTRVLHIAASLGPCAAAKQLALLLPHLGDGHRVLSLGPVVPFAEKMGTPVTRVSVRHPFDVRGIAAVRTAVLLQRPAVIHAWGGRAICVAALLRRTLGYQCHLVVTGDTGLPAVLLGPHTPVPMPRAVVPSVAVDRAAVRASLGIPPDVPLLAVSGGFDAAANLRDAVWAFDLLKYAAPTARLLVVGDGPGRASLERFQAGLAFDDDRVTFTGLRADAAELFAAADLFWAVAKHCGFNAAAEALAAGTPVVAFENPVLAGLPVRPVPFGDKPALAKETYALLQNPPPRTVPDLSAFAVGPLASHLLRVYDSPTACPFPPRIGRRHARRPHRHPRRRQGQPARTADPRPRQTRRPVRRGVPHHRLRAE